MSFDQGSLSDLILPDLDLRYLSFRGPNKSDVLGNIYIEPDIYIYLQFFRLRWLYL